ncbi:response regulator transcription factor [Ruminiclostridium cellobioparum]|nr:response regulator [Ruminiclostridium cellobioparum]
MQKVMIVDDELRIRQGLAKLIEWEEYGLEIVCEAANGKDALRQLEENEINVIVTDIKMPVMDGIELIKEINKRALDVRIIVLSGFDDFSFVKNAMKLGAENYLLKPVNKEELLGTIKDMLEDIKSKRISDIQNRAGLTYLRNNTLNRIVKNEIKPNELRDKSELLELNIWTSSMQVAIFQPYLPNGKENESHEEGQDLLSAIFSICEESVKPYADCITFIDSNGRIVYIFNLAGEKLERNKSLLLNCQQKVIAGLGIHSAVALGSIVESQKHIHLSYQQAVQSLDYKIVYGPDRIILYSEIRKRFEHKHEEVNIYEEWIQNCISASKAEELTACIDNVFRDIKDQGTGISPEQVRNITMKIILAIFHKAREFFINTEKIIDYNEYMVFWSISKADDIDELRKLSIDIGIKVINAVQQQQSKRYSKTVEYIINYIQNNYSQQDICLKTMANQMDVSAVHLGRIFKNETGMFFSDYLNQIRIQEAKRMLVETNIKIRDITEKVGFVNTSYFFTVFKKVMGVTPGEIRQV